MIIDANNDIMVLTNRMQEHEGWLTHLSPGVVSQLEIPLANHLQYKRKVKAVKTLTYILRIGSGRGDIFL